MPKTPRKRVGSWVALKRPRLLSVAAERARIVEECPEFARGAVRLSEPLDGFRWWNKADLIVAEPPRGRHAAR